MMPKKKKHPTLITLLIALMSVSLLTAQPEPAPTFVPPTPLPATVSEPDLPLLTESALVRILADETLRVGVLYNEPPYSEFNIRGEIIGYSADVARAIADAWQVEIEFIQVTRTNGIDRLKRGAIDILMGATIHRRELDASVEFSQTYRLGAQSLMLRADDETTNLANMVNRRVAYVVGTEGEIALREWQAETNIPITTQPFLTLDQAFSALINQEVDGLVSRRSRLLQVATTDLERIKILDEPVQPEPHAIAMRRHDNHLRNMLNRTLQFLLEDGTLEDLHSQYFPGETFAFDVLPLWSNIGDDAPDPRFSPTTISYPVQYVIPRLSNDRTLRVAGLIEPPADTNTGERRIFTFQQALLQEMASRWNVTIQPISGDPLQAITDGQADIAVGLPLDWQYVERLDFSAPYLLHGERLMVPANSPYNSFNDLRGRWVGVMSSEPGASERAQAWAQSINVRINIYTTTERDAAFAMLVDNNADVIYADSLKLIPHLEESPNLLRLTARWYSREYRAFALPKNDLDWRLLVDYTLQDIFADGTLLRLLQPVIPPDSEPPTFDVWYGTANHLGF